MWNTEDDQRHKDSTPPPQSESPRMTQRPRSTSDRMTAFEGMLAVCSVWPKLDVKFSRNVADFFCCTTLTRRAGEYSVSCSDVAVKEIFTLGTQSPKPWRRIQANVRRGDTVAGGAAHRCLQACSIWFRGTAGESSVSFVILPQADVPYIGLCRLSFPCLSFLR